MPKVELPPDVFERLYRADRSFTALKMRPLSPTEIRLGVEKLMAKKTAEAAMAQAPGMMSAMAGGAGGFMGGGAGQGGPAGPAIPGGMPTGSAAPAAPGLPGGM